jgi:type 1 glutamine amidotransferase
LGQLDKVTATTVFGFPSEEQFKKADLAIFNHRNEDFSEQQQMHVDAFLKAGKGMIVVHQGLAPTKGAKAWADRIGFAYVPGKKGSKWGIGELKMEIENSHPIFKGFPQQMSFNEELYWELAEGTTPGFKLLGKSSLPNDEKVEWPLFWVVESGKKGEGGKVFCTVIGHYNDFTESPFFKIVIHRAAAWCLDEPFEAFAEIVK